MSGSGLMDFLIVIVGLFIVGAMIFAALEFIATDPRFKKIAQLAVGGVLVLAFLFAIKGVLFGGAGAQVITPSGLIQFAIGVIVLLVVWFIINAVLDWAATWFAPLGPVMAIVKFVVAAIVLIVLLILAADMLFGAGTMGPFSPFRPEHRSQLTLPQYAGYQSVQFDNASATVNL